MGKLYLFCTYVIANHSCKTFKTEGCSILHDSLIDQFKRTMSIHFNPSRLLWGRLEWQLNDCFCYSEYDDDLHFTKRI